MAVMVDPRLLPRTRAESKDLRRRKRIKLSLAVHVRPFDARLIKVEDVGEVVDFSKDGLFFVTCMPHYSVGMRLILTFPFSDAASAHRKFLGTVVRLVERPGGQWGVAVRFLL